MSTTTVTKKGQITIPKPIRDRLGLKEGDKVIAKFCENEVYIRKITFIFDLEGSVRVPEKVKKLGWKEIEKKAHENMAKRIKP